MINSISQNPHFFISGPERGGTTVLGSLVSQHPDIFVVLSSILITRFHNLFSELKNAMQHSSIVQKICKDLPMTDAASLVQDERPVHPMLLNWYLNIVYRNYTMPARAFDSNKDPLYTLRHAEILDLGKVSVKAKEEQLNWRGVISLLLNELVPDEYLDTYKALGEQTPDNAVHNRIICGAFPEAKFLFIFRNPFSNVASIYRRRKSEGLDKAIKVYLLPFICIKQNLEAMAPRTLFIRLEDVLSNRNIALKQIFSFLNVENIPISEGHHSYLTPKYVGTQLESRRHQESQQALSSGQRDEVKEKCASVLQDFYPEII